MTDPKALSRQIRDLVAEDDIKGAIEVLKENLLDMDELNELVLKSARFEALLKKERSGTIDYNTLELEKNKLRQSLLFFANDIQTEKKKPVARKTNPIPTPQVATTSHTAPAKKKSKLPLIIIGAVLLIAAVGGVFTMMNSAGNNSDDGVYNPTNNAGIAPSETDNGQNEVSGTPAANIPEVETPVTTYDQPEEPINNNDAASNGVVVVSNAMELLNAIKSNTHIQLKAGTYELSEASRSWPGSEYFQFMEGAEDWGGGTMTGVENLTLTGETGVKIMTENPDYDVFKLLSCENITFENLFFGHPENMDGCMAGVISISGSYNIIFEDCILHGSGTVGIKANNSGTIELNRSIIQKCTSSFLSAQGCEFIHCYQSVFETTIGYIGFEAYDTELRFDNCTVRNNSFSASLFYIYGSGGVSMIDSDVSTTSYPEMVTGNVDGLSNQGTNFN